MIETEVINESEAAALQHAMDIFGSDGSSMARFALQMICGDAIAMLSPEEAQIAGRIPIGLGWLSTVNAATLRTTSGVHSRHSEQLAGNGTAGMDRNGRTRGASRVVRVG